MKKLLATLLSLCMLLSLLPATAFAADEQEPETPAVEETLDDAEEAAEAEEAEEAAEAEEAEDVATMPGIGFSFGPIISIEELKDKGLIPEDYESEDADVETGLVEEPVIQVEDNYDDDNDDATATTPAEEELEVVIVPVEDTEDDEYAIATMSATVGNTTITGAPLVDHAGCFGEENPKTHTPTPDTDATTGDGHTIFGTESAGKYEVTKKGEGTLSYTNSNDEAATQKYYELDLNATGLYSTEENAGHTNIEGDVNCWIGLTFAHTSSSTGNEEGSTPSRSPTYYFYGKTEPTAEQLKAGLTGGTTLDGALYIGTGNYNTNKSVWFAIDWGDGTVEYYKVNINYVINTTNPDTNTGNDPQERPETTEPDDSSSDDAPATNAPAPGVTAPETSGSTTTVEVSNSTSTNGTTASADISDSKMEAAVDSAIAAAAQSGTNAEVKIDLKTSNKADSLNVTLPAASLKTLAESNGSTLAITSGVANVTLNHSALAAVAGQATGKSITLEVAPVAADKLTDAQKAAVGDAKVVDVALFSGAAAITDFGSGEITVTLPYTLADGQSEGDIVVYLLADDGTMTPVTARFENGQLVVTTVRLGKLVIK